MSSAKWRPSQGAEEGPQPMSSTQSSAWNPLAFADGETEAEDVRKPTELTHAPQAVPKTPSMPPSRTRLPLSCGRRTGGANLGHTIFLKGLAYLEQRALSGGGEGDSSTPGATQPGPVPSARAGLVWRGEQKHPEQTEAWPAPARLPASGRRPLSSARLPTRLRLLPEAGPGQGVAGVLAPLWQALGLLSLACG